MKLDSNISRRKFIRQIGSVGAISTIAPTVLFTQCSIPTSMYWQNWPSETQEAFVGAVSWLIEYTLDRAFPHMGKSKETILQLIKELAVKKVNPRPTSNSFHNSHASPYIVTNPTHQFNSQYSRRVKYYVQLDNYIRSGNLGRLLDLSTSEISRLAYELKPYRTILFPISQRTSPNAVDRDHYKQTSINKYRVSPDLMRLEYVRDFSDGSKLYKSYGVRSRRTGQSDLLISV